MPLTEAQIRELLRILGATEEEEITCDECLPLMAALNDGSFGPRHGSRLRDLVEQHLTVCPECAEEHALLEEALKALD